METLFHFESSAFVISARLLKVTEVFTKYAVPISFEVASAFSDDVIDPVVKAAVGTAVSTVTDSAEDVVALPAASVSVTEMLQIPSARVASVQAFEVIVHETLVDPAFVAVTTAVPEKDPEALIVGVESEVKLSVDELPVSEAISRSGVDGELGAVVSTTMALLAPKDPVAVGAGSVKTASKFAEFLTVPLFSASELVAA